MKNSHIVVKKDDVSKYCSLSGERHLEGALSEVVTGRMLEGKPINNYIVVNMDETYIEEIIEVLRRNGQWED